MLHLIMKMKESTNLTQTWKDVDVVRSVRVLIMRIGSNTCNIDRMIEITYLSENKVRSAVENMIEMGLLEASGNGKNRSYILGRTIYREIDESIQYVRQTYIDSIRYPELVLKLARTQGGIITKQDICDLLKITPSQAYSLIKKLQRDNKLFAKRG